MSKKSTSHGTNGTTGRVTEFRVPKVRNKENLKRVVKHVKDGIGCMTQNFEEASKFLPKDNPESWAVERGLAPEGVIWLGKFGMDAGFTIAQVRRHGLSREDSITLFRKWVDFIESTGL